ncbi:hypothetical protein LH61_05615 [Leuconostoc mesenteroides P45]|uniref:NEAT domain-containing protein n=1 Tax=Leuconostoc mesenteroides TaxID=1245 RepID=UPI000504B4B0|nr:NEAT domain-containing protein [Leuconostoc mesenteroides]KGB50957.1 hypothetical protein LH61_05615 [Leuconostoc mesenteroides P45]
MEKNKVLVLAGTLAVSGAILMNGDVVKAADTSNTENVVASTKLGLQSGRYTATANLYKSGTTDASMMSRMINKGADVVIKGETATITLTFGQANYADMVTSWTINGVQAIRQGQAFIVTVSVADLSKTLSSTINVATTLPGGVPFTESQPVDIKLNDITLVACDPEEVAAEKAAETAKQEAANKAKLEQEAAQRQEAANKAKLEQEAAQKQEAANKAKLEQEAAQKQEAANKAKLEQEAAQKQEADEITKAAVNKTKINLDPHDDVKSDQTGTSQYKVKLYKSGTTNASMMSSMISPTATVVTKEGQSTVTLNFKDMATINMVKSWVINGVPATKSDQSFVVVLPTADLGKILHTVIDVSTTIGGMPFSETQPVDLLLQAGTSVDNTNLNTDQNPDVAPAQTLGHDTPLTSQLTSTSKLPNTATNETTTAPLVAVAVSGILALGLWFKKVLR